MTNNPKKTIFSPSSGLESPRPDSQTRSIFTQSPSLPRPQTTYISQMQSTTSPLLEGIPRVSSNNCLKFPCTNAVPRIPAATFSQNRESSTENSHKNPKNPEKVDKTGENTLKLELFERKVVLLEDENRKLAEINAVFLGNQRKISDFEGVVRKTSEENARLSREISTKTVEIARLEKLLAVHQEEHNSSIKLQKKHLEEAAFAQNAQLLSEIRELHAKLREKDERNRENDGKTDEIRREYATLLAKFAENATKFEEQVQRNVELEQKYAKNMLDYKAEIAEIRANYEEKVRESGVSKEKFAEFVAIMRAENEKLRAEVREKAEESAKLRHLLGNTAENAGNLSEFAGKRYKIDDFGEKLACLVQENEKLNEKSAICEAQAMQWREKYADLKEKVRKTQEIRGNSRGYLSSEPDFHEEQLSLKEKSLTNTQNLPRNSSFSKENPRNSQQKVVRNANLQGFRAKINNENAGPAKIVRKNSSSAMKTAKIERNFSYSIRKNY